MHEAHFVTKRENVERNISEFTTRALKYGVTFGIDPLAFDEVRVHLEGAPVSKLALLTGILTRKEEE